MDTADGRERLRQTFDTVAAHYHVARPGYPGALYDTLVSLARLAPDQDEILLAGRLPALARRVFPAGALWAAWPRRAAGHDSDITDNVVRRHALGLGLVDVKVAAIDDDWSGLRLVWRTSER